MNSLQIMPYQPGDFEALVRLGQALWPDSTRDDYAAVVESTEQAVFFGADAAGEIHAFVIVALRRDYVEGTNSSPVGYIEGIYVSAAYRKQGMGRNLILAAEDWARNQGCEEMGSDTELENTDSQQFHMKAGFREINRIISFAKRIV